MQYARVLIGTNKRDLSRFVDGKPAQIDAHVLVTHNLMKCQTLSGACLAHHVEPNLHLFFLPNWKRQILLMSCEVSCLPNCCTAAACALSSVDVILTPGLRSRGRIAHATLVGPFFESTGQKKRIAQNTTASQFHATIGIQSASQCLMRRFLRRACSCFKMRYLNGSIL